MSAPLTLSLPRSLEAFDELVPAVDAYFRREGVQGRAAYVAHLVLEEVLRNLVEHADATGRERVEVKLQVVPPLLRVAIVDDCEPFDPRTAPELDLDTPLEGRSTGGMGLHLVRTLAEALRYERVGGRNRLEVDIALGDVAGR